MIGLTQEVSEMIWSILVLKCGVQLNSQNREDFIYSVFHGKWTEFRFHGNLGFGGKVWNGRGRIYVTCYAGDENDDRRRAIAEANELLEKVVCRINEAIKRGS